MAIGDQCWFAENLRTTVYADDSSIPEVTDNSAWSGLSTGARCDYNNDAANVAAYGRLYNWFAVTNVAGLCPNGWHVPTDGEWTALEDYITAQGFSGTEGTALKSTSWLVHGGNGTDDFGFSALPGGYRSSSDGYFYSAGSSATGGVLRPVAAMLGTGLGHYASRHQPERRTIRDSASRSGVLGMPIERSEGGLTL